MKAGNYGVVLKERTNASRLFQERLVKFGPMTKYREIDCPYCSQSQVMAVDCREEVRDYFKACQICRKQISVRVLCSCDGDLLDLTIKSTSE